MPEGAFYIYLLVHVSIKFELRFLALTLANHTKSKVLNLKSGGSKN